MLQEYLREFYYMAQMASLHASMSLPHDNYNISWSGFSDSLPIFVEETLKRMRSFNVAEHKEFFDQCKEKLLQEWHNFYLEQTYRQAIFLFENVVLTTAFEKKALRKILESLSFEDFVRQSHGWLNSARFVWFVHGNLSKEQALGLVDKARETLKPRAVAKEDLVDVRCIALPSGKRILIERELDDKTNENNCLITYFEVGLEGMDLRTKMLH